MSTLNMSWLDQLCIHFDQGLRTVFGQGAGATRPHPDANITSGALSTQEKKHVTGLMRVNHCGEVCAQALYQGQALTARKTSVTLALQQAAAEEQDHLAWCYARLTKLNSHASYLNVVWYLAAMLTGLSAGLLGDKISLGFLAETEYQVVAHLKRHLEKLPDADTQSRAILSQMIVDESQHATTALAQGGVELPWAVKTLMRSAAKVMTTTAYYI